MTYDYLEENPCFCGILTKYFTFTRKSSYFRINFMIINNISKVRNEKNHSLRKLAYKTKLSKSTLFRLENNDTVLDLVKLEKIAIALGCKITDLFDSEYK